jgi:hypothetical protein
MLSFAIIREMVDLVAWATDPGLPERLSALGYTRISALRTRGRSPTHWKCGNKLEKLDGGL